MFPVQTAIKALLSALPEKAEPFCSEYPCPFTPHTWRMCLRT